MAECLSLSEPVEIARWWRRGEAISVRLTMFNGHHLVDLRTWFTDAGKGFSANVKDLSKLAAALAKALERARELGVVEGNESPSDRHAGEAEPTGRFSDLAGSEKPSGSNAQGSPTSQPYRGSPMARSAKSNVIPTQTPRAAERPARRGRRHLDGIEGDSA